MRPCDGHTTVVPSLLRRLESPANFMDERSAFDTLRLALIRCGEVDEVSYAAVPHLARLSKSGALVEWEYIGLLAEVEARRACGFGPEVPQDLAAAYFKTINDLPRLVGEVRPKEAREEPVAVLAGALAVALGQPRLGMAIMELGGMLQHGGGNIECPACGEEIELTHWSG